jgi:hypothetical protein
VDVLAAELSPDKGFAACCTTLHNSRLPAAQQPSQQSPRLILHETMTSALTDAVGALQTVLRT